MEHSFPAAALIAATYGLNNVTESSRLTDVAFSEDALTFTLQEGTEAALVIHLLPDGRHDVTLAGDPSREARRAMQTVCASIAREWRKVPEHLILCLGAMRASLDCIH